MVMTGLEGRWGGNASQVVSSPLFAVCTSHANETAKKVKEARFEKKKKQTQCNMKKEPLFFLPKRSACKVKKKSLICRLAVYRLHMYIIRSYFVIPFLFL